MSLAPGTRVGSYEITALLGAGGMGEVYRARDMRLNRDVAIKVLPPLFASDPERLARFEREAQTLASLNHPNIAQIHGVVEPSDGVPAALVMECVEGEDLAQRLTRGPLPMDDALAIARQMADGLGAAHDRGIVHRDLKPANVKVSPDGVVKILDFGLAKAVEKDSTGLDSGADLANSPTFTATSTQLGVILGTAAYMSPEQARGKRTDHRADIWAFACVLYEMLTGAKPFQASDDSVAGVLAKILERDPDFGLLPQNTPASVRRLLRRCFEKNPSRRLASAHDAALEIDDARTTAESVPSAVQHPERSSLPWLIAAALGVALAVTAGALWRFPRGLVAQVMRYDIQLPRTVSLALAQWPPLAISRDGSVVAFVGESESGTHIFLRQRNESIVQAIPGTEGGSSPVFSPDGRWLLFAAGRELKKMMIGSGPTTVASLETSRGATWLDDGSIVFSRDAATGLFRLPSSGGPPQNLTTIDTIKGERSHRWPVALPGGKAVLFIVGTNSSPDDYNDADVDAVILATGQRRHVLTGASFVQYVAHHLIFMRNGAIQAVPFNPDSLTVTGTPVPVVDGVGGDVTTGAAAFACADDGTLVYAAGGSGRNGNLRRLVWADRTGAVEPLNLPPALYNDQRISPDGGRIAVILGGTGSGDVWIYDVSRGTFTRLTFDGNIGTPIWSPDGRSVIYASIEASATGRTTFLTKPVDGSRQPEKLATVDGRSYLAAINRAGDRLTIVKTTDTQTRVADILAVSIPNGSQTPLVATNADEYSASPSFDGHWLAYESNESGRYEVYVRDLREGGGRWQISTAGGEEPHWSADGRELFFRTGDRLMHVQVSLGDPFGADTPAKLFDGIYNLRSDTGVSYDVNPKTGRFLMTRPADPGAPASVTTLDVVLNWFDDLRRAR